jgi:hypothetical protein
VINRDEKSRLGKDDVMMYVMFKKLKVGCFDESGRYGMVIWVEVLRKFCIWCGGMENVTLQASSD